MADPPKLSLDLSEAQGALSAFVQRDGKNAADELTQIFVDASSKIARELDRVARGGEFSFKRLAGNVLADLGRVAVDNIFQGKGLSPEVGGAGGGTIVNFHLGAGADAESIRRNQAQIAAQVARAVDYGNRNR
jgi:hypothetical protein